MKRTIFALVFGVLSMGSIASEIKQVPNGLERRCLSLRVLEDRVERALKLNRPIPGEVLNLGGIGYIEGFVVDRAGKGDVILIGLVDRRRKGLRLDDLVVSIRSIWNGKSHPYCSLDPTNESSSALNKLFQRGYQPGTPIEGFIEKMVQAAGPQQTVVGGVPRNSRHARIMLAADYHMKRVSQMKSPFEGILSPLVLSLKEAEDAHKAGKPVPNSGGGMSRFWFHIGEDAPRFIHDSDVVWLSDCPVVLLTNRQQADASGELHDVPGDDPQATQFAKAMSEGFAELAASKVPVYAELENLYRLYAVVLAMNHRKAPTKARLSFDRFLSTYQYQDEVLLDNHYKALANADSRQFRSRTGKNVISTMTYYSFVCGGVSMQMNVEEGNFRRRRNRPRPDGQLQKLRSAALLARPTQETLYWPLSSNDLSGFFQSRSVLVALAPKN